MNKYLNRNEKQSMVRLHAVWDAAHLVLDYYASGRNVDKNFTKYLKTGMTFFEKALKIRMDYLARDAQEDWLESCDRLDCFLVPSEKSKREVEERMKLANKIVFDQEELYDWFSAIIPSTCGRCYGMHKEKCLLHKQLMKYNLPPLDNNPAPGRCQYSYIAAGLDPAEIFRDILEEEIADKRKHEEEKKK